MQVTETQNEGLKRAYKMVLTAQELDDKVMDKLKEAQPDIEMKGFRKGKVPLPLLKKQFGQRVLGEAMQEAVDGAMSQHFEDKGERPAGEPAVKMVNEDWKEGDDVVVSMTYEKLPEIPEVDFKAISLEKMVVTPAEADVQEALDGVARAPRDLEARVLERGEARERLARGGRGGRAQHDAEGEAQPRQLDQIERQVGFRRRAARVLGRVP